MGSWDQRRRREKIRMYRDRIGENRFYRSIRARYQSEEIVRVERKLSSFVFSRVIRPENNRNDRCVVAIPFADRQYLIGFGAVFFRRPASGGFDLLDARDRVYLRTKDKFDRWP